MKIFRIIDAVSWAYGALVLIAVAAAAVRLHESTDMPGLAAIELVLLGLPWSLALQIEPFSHFGWIGMLVIVAGGVAANTVLLRKLSQTAKTPDSGACGLFCVLNALGLLAASFLGSAGCSGHAPYPKTWPPLRPVPTQSCERVAGSYWNRGERGQMEHYGPVYLTEMLLNVPRGTETEMVTLTFLRPDEFDVVIAGAQPEPRRVSLSRKAGQYRCDGSTLVINTSPAKWVGGVAQPGVPVVGGESVAMKVDLVEGCLIVTKRDKDFLWLPFPGWSTWSSWYRFCAVPSDRSHRDDAGRSRTDGNGPGTSIR